MQRSTSKFHQHLYAGMARRICILFGSFVLLSEAIKWFVLESRVSAEISIAIGLISAISIVVGSLSTKLIWRRCSAWMCAFLILCFPLLVGIQVGGLSALTLSFAVAFPVFFTLLLGPKHTIFGAIAASLLILILGYAPIAEIQTWLIGESLPVSNAVLSKRCCIEGFIATLMCAAATHTIARQNKAMHDKLNHDAVFDNLTGIPNRRAFDRQIDNEIERARRVKTPLSMIVFDIDDFKMYNDEYGHQAGDRAIQAVARAIDSVCVRSTDFVARYGGEEFVVLLPSTTNDRAELLAGKIRTNLCRIKNSPIADHQITLSAGIAVLNGEPKVDSDELFRRADQALYESKRGGKDRVTVYSKKLRSALKSTRAS